MDVQQLGIRYRRSEKLALNGLRLAFAVVFNGILSDAAQATAGCRVPSVMPTSAASEGPPPR
jgi:hypothetical protein